MRCDNLKRHMKIHESNTSSKTQTATSDDTDQLDVSALADKVIDDKELEKVLINDNCVYKQKCKLGSIKMEFDRRVYNKNTKRH